MSRFRNGITVKVSGLRSLETKFRAVPEVTTEACIAGVAACAMVLRNEVVRLLQKGPKTGRTYKRRSVLHRASAPGEAPATDTGALVRSVMMDVLEASLEAVVSVGTLYAKMLEFGTLLMGKRPFMSQAVDNKRDELSGVFTRAAQFVMRRHYGR
jgi:HK97 gp10 family phage protein